MTVDGMTDDEFMIQWLLNRRWEGKQMFEAATQALADRGVTLKTWDEITKGPEADEIRRCIAKSEANSLRREWGDQK